MKAVLVLATGESFTGTVLGSATNVQGNIVFNTSMNAYEDVLFDSELKDEIVCMTYPEIGNTGVDLLRIAQESVHLKGLIIKSACRNPSGDRSKIQVLEDFLQEKGVSGIMGIDTRQVTKIIRDNPGLKAGIFVGDVSVGDALAQLA